MSGGPQHVHLCHLQRCLLSSRLPRSISGLTPVLHLPDAPLSHRHLSSSISTCLLRLINLFAAASIALHCWPPSTNPPLSLSLIPVPSPFQLSPSPQGHTSASPGSPPAALSSHFKSQYHLQMSQSM